MTDISESISEQEKVLIQEKAGTSKIGMYLDIGIYKQIGTDEETAVSELNQKVTIVLKVPEHLVNTNSDIKRSYGMIHIHNGSAEYIVPIYDETNQTLSFETDRFSTFAIVYNDEWIETNESSSNESSSNESSSNENSSNENSSNESENSSETVAAVSPKTGEDTATLPWLLLGFGIVEIVLFVGKKKQNPM